MKNVLYKIRLIFAIIVFILSILAIVYSFFVIGISNIKHILVGLPAMIAILIGIVTITTLLFGRIFCSLFCPLGIFQEIITLFNNRDSEKQPNYPAKYIISIVVFISLFAVIKYIKLNTLFNYSSEIAIGAAVFILLVGILAFFKNRFFCTDICPCGAVVGLLSKFSLFKLRIDKNECLSCGMCERNCPSSCIDVFEEDIENETCVKCLKCMANCPKEAIKYTIKNPNN